VLCGTGAVVLAAGAVATDAAGTVFETSVIRCVTLGFARLTVFAGVVSTCFLAGLLCATAVRDVPVDGN
jgi:hypothetical protein